MVLFLVVCVFGCVCHRDKSNRLSYIIMKFLWESDMVKKIGRVRKWLHSDVLRRVVGDLTSTTF